MLDLRLKFEAEEQARESNGLNEAVVERAQRLGLYPTGSTGQK